MNNFGYIVSVILKLSIVFELSVNDNIMTNHHRSREVLNWFKFLSYISCCHGNPKLFGTLFAPLIYSANTHAWASRIVDV